MGRIEYSVRIAINNDRFIETMQEQAQIGATEGGGLHRLTLSDADREIRDWFVDQLTALDLSVRIDEFGNTFGRRPGNDPDAAPVLVGSHLDSQPYGGIYDGPLGVISALELLRTLEDESIETRHPIEIVNWTNEEGSRFPPAMQGSGVWAGAHDLETEYEKTDRDGNKLIDELERIGYCGDEPAEPAEPYEAYLELHIEQGPVLDQQDKDVGVVTDIVGFTWGQATFSGQANHAGTTPMHMRNDALVAAADFITGIRRFAPTLGHRTVGTTGSIELNPNSINIVPDSVTATWDIRDPDDDVVERAAACAVREAEYAAEREGVDVDIEHLMRAPSVDFSDRCVQAVQRAAVDLGYDSLQLISGAGHDATNVASICDTAMVFSVSEDGKSHTEDEYTSWPDCYSAGNTLANAVLDLAEPIEK
ncbi:MAG: Zn-dependent hydrolase [Halobacteriota archaeon]